MKPLVLVILDGWGYSRDTLGNAIAQAKTPVMDHILRTYPALLLQASGTAIGLSWGEAGNSEVGHFALGTGRVIQQYFNHINQAIENDTFFKNVALTDAVTHVKKNNSALHLVGLLTSNSVHAAFGHLVALLELAKRSNLGRVYLHLFTDGKDSGLKEAPILLAKLSDEIAKHGTGVVVTVVGRDIAMDRVNNWELTRQTFELLVHGTGNKTADIISQLGQYYDTGLTDINIPPTVVTGADGSASGFIRDNDAVVMFNFREDRTRQLAHAFLDDDAKYFPKEKPKNLFVASLTPLTEHPNLHVAFSLPFVANTLSQALHMARKKQFHIAEMEKYAHVTYFFNGLRNEVPETETDVILESHTNLVEQPDMRAPDIGERVLQELVKGEYDFMLINFANADMLAHLGNLGATMRGVETIDRVLGTIKDAVLDREGILIITADHGNAESLTYRGTGQVETRHNENPVPLYLVARPVAHERSPKEIERELAGPQGILADVAPTILEIMELPKPPEMTGKSLLPLLGCENLRI